MPFSVLLRDELLPLPVEALAPILQEVLGGLIYDRLRELKTRAGWLAQRLTRAQALELVEALKAAGFVALALEEEELKAKSSLGSVLQIRRAEIRAEALLVEVGLLGELQPLSWSAVSLVSIGVVQGARQVQVTKSKRKLGLSRAGLLMGVPLPKSRTVKSKQLVRAVDERLLVQLVYGAEGVVRELRPSSFDFSVLGPRLRATSAENLALVLGDMLGFIDPSRWTRMAQVLASGEAPPQAFASEKELLRFTEWRVAVSAA